MKSYRLIKLLALAPMCLLSNQVLSAPCDAGVTNSPHETTVDCSLDGTNTTIDSLEFKGAHTVTFESGANALTAITSSANKQGIFSTESNFTTSANVADGNALSQLNVDSGNFSAGHNINSDTINVNNGGTLTTTGAGVIDFDVSAMLTVNSGGTLSLQSDAEVKGMMIALVNAGGTLDVGANTITGNVVLVPASNFGVSISSNTASGQITGVNTSMNTTTVVDVTILPGVLVPNGQSYLIMNGGTGTKNAPVTVNSNSSIVSFASSVVGDGKVDITASRIPYTTLSNDPKVFEVANALDVSLPGASGDLATILGTIDTLGTTQAFNDALATLNPEMNRATADISFGLMNDAFKVVQDRIQGLNNTPARPPVAYAAGDGEQYYGVWARPFGHYSDHSGKDGFEGYHAYSFGIGFGMDTTLYDQWRLGIAYAYGVAHADAQGAREGNTVREYSHNILAYMNYDHPCVLMDLMLGVGLNHYKSHRNIRILDIHRLAQASYDGFQLSSKFKIGLPIRTGVDILPYASISYHFLNMDDYRERGADSVNLMVTEQDYKAAFGSVGLQVGRFLDRETNTYGFFHAGVKSDFFRDQSKSRATLVGSGVAFDAIGVTPDRLFGLLGGNFGYAFDKRTTATAHYELAFSEHSFSNALVLELRSEFL